MNKVFVVEIAALGHEFLLRNNGGNEIEGLRFRPIRSVFPAVTCAVQASFRTGEPPARHGMVGNGFYSREFARAFFWEQSSALVEGPRIWDAFRRSGGTVGQLFWQQSLGPDADILVSPAPIHKHHGGMIQDCFSRPARLYADLVRKLGRPFDLMHYWGPRSSVKASSWIVEATVEIMRGPAPELLLTYLPHLDYELQRSGPDSKGAARSFEEMKSLLGRLLASARERGYKVIVFGDYAMVPVRRPVYPNRSLLDAGLLDVRNIRGMTYPDLYTSRAFAVVDHQIAHVILKDEVYLRQTRVPSDGQLLRFPDLPDALRENPHGEWRVHFHVPLHFSGGGGLETTAPLLDAAFFSEALAPDRHLEIETYSFGVLPGPREDVVDSITSEFDWLLGSESRESGPDVPAPAA